MRIKMTEERKSEVSQALVGFFKDEFDEDLSEFRALEVVDFMLGQIGPSQYNQGIADARGFLLEKLDDLDTEFYEPEEN